MLPVSEQPTPVTPARQPTSAIIKAIRIFLAVLIVIGLGLIVAYKFWVPKLTDALIPPSVPAVAQTQMPIMASPESNNVLIPVPATSIVSSPIASATATCQEALHPAQSKVGDGYLIVGGRVYADLAQGCVLLKGVDGESFSASSFIKDKSDVYFFRSGSGYIDDDVLQLSGIDPASLRALIGTSSPFAADAHHVYLMNTYEADMVSGADPATFSSLAPPDYFADKNHIYIAYQPPFCKDGFPSYDMKSLNTADRATFTVVDAKDGYSKDVMHVYYWGDLISGADPKTFQVLNLADQYGNFDGLSRDANHLYWRNEQVNLSPDTLKLEGSYAVSSNGTAQISWNGGCDISAISSFQMEATSTSPQNKPVSAQTTPIASSTIPAPVYSNTGTTTGTVIGYIWKSDSGSPLFSSVVVPAWGTLGSADFNMHEYDLYIFKDGAFTFYQQAKALEQVTFPAGGVSEFEVLSIDPQLGICATDQNVAWGITFSQDGQFKGSRTSITTATSNPACVSKTSATPQNQ